MEVIRQNVLSLWWERERERDLGWRKRVVLQFHFQQIFEGVCVNDTNEKGCQMCNKWGCRVMFVVGTWSLFINVISLLYFFIFKNMIILVEYILI
jgi:hypothetical protein